MVDILPSLYAAYVIHVFAQTLQFKLPIIWFKRFIWEIIRVYFSYQLRDLRDLWEAIVSQASSSLGSNQGRRKSMKRLGNILQ